MALQALRESVKQKLLSKLLNGKNVYCNICEHSYSTFLPNMKRINSQCPNCGSKERTRLIYELIKDTGFIKGNNIRLLHVAPEKCFYTLFSKKLKNNYIPADKFEPGYKYPSNTISMDITKINFPDESFDRVICIHVLEHVQDDKQAISELYRVLKKNGMAILMVPYDKNRETTYEDSSITDPLEREKHFLQSDHVRIYGRDFLDRFLEPGFKIEYENYSEKMDSNLKQMLVVKDEEIFILRK